jgi:hypothetical protein
MVSRVFVAAVIAFLALESTPASAADPAAVPAQAGGSAPTAAATVVRYQVVRTGPQVTVKDGAGKVLLTRRAATPTLRAVVVKDATRHLSFTLEDANGLRLWSTVVPVAPPGTLNVKSGADLDGSEAGHDLDGTRFIFTHAAQETPGSHDPHERLVCTIGPDGKAISLNANGQVYKFAYTSTGMTVSGTDGTQASVTAPAPGTAVMDVNGAKIQVETVQRDGRAYYSFPWNGHPVLIDSRCTFVLGPDGVMTVNAPPAAGTPVAASSK